MTEDLTGRSVLVTGGTKGVGAAIATRFLAAGAEVDVCARSRPAEPPSSGGRSARFVAANVRDPAEAAAAVQAVVERTGRLDVLVNNAGGAPVVAAAEASPRLFASIVDLNLTAAFSMAQAANAVMQQQASGGCIVNIGSMAADTPAVGTSAYTAAKAGLRALTRALALEWAPQVRVNHLTVGLVRTELSDEYYGDTETIDRLIALGRMATPDDVADACLLLTSSLAGYVTGADLRVDGGGELPAWQLSTGSPSGSAGGD